MDLVLGGETLGRNVLKAEAWLASYRQDPGYYYLAYRPAIPPGMLTPEDLAITLLVNGRASGLAFKSLADRGPAIHLETLPQKPLEATTAEERHVVAELITEMCRWPGFGASLTTKVLHKKRPDLIPILDNQAIFGAYLNPEWPAQRSTGVSVKELAPIEQALGAIAFDLVRPENADVWPELQKLEPTLTRIELLDAVWWMYFRSTEQVPAASQLAPKPVAKPAPPPAPTPAPKPTGKPPFKPPFKPGPKPPSKPPFKAPPRRP
jgi:hypothetical protein